MRQLLVIGEELGQVYLCVLVDQERNDGSRYDTQRIGNDSATLLAPVHTQPSWRTNSPFVERKEPLISVRFP